MDYSTARSLVASKVEDPNLSRFTTDQYSKAIDLAEEQFAIDARAILKGTTLTSVSGTAAITLPTDFLCVALVRHKGLKLRPVTRYEMSFQGGDDWTTKTGTPVAFYIDEEDETLVLVPIPQDADAGANVTLDYVAVPANISSDTQLLLNEKTILQYYAPAIVAWAARELLSYVTMTPDVMAKRAELLKEYNLYREHAIVTYQNMADEPLRMSGGRDWQDVVVKPQGNAFDY